MTMRSIQTQYRQRCSATAHPADKIHSSDLLATQHYHYQTYAGHYEKTNHET